MIRTGEEVKWEFTCIVCNVLEFFKGRGKDLFISSVVKVINKAFRLIGFHMEKMSILTP